MKRLVVVVVIGLLSSINANSQSLHDTQREGLHGPVRTVETESSETMSMGSLQSEVRKRKLDSLTFNRDGRLVQRVVYDDYGFLVGTEGYSHNTDGDTVQTELTNEKGSLEEKRVYNYQKGKLKEILTYDANGSLTLKEVYQYDAAGHLIEQRYFASGKSIGRTLFQTDDAGHAVDASFFLANGTKAVAPIGPCFNVHRVAYSYDTRGRVIEEVAYKPDGSEKRKSMFLYDEKDRVAEEKRIDYYSTLKFVHQYDDDEKGSWTKETILVHTSRRPLYGDKPDESVRRIIKTRKITYYPQ